jgi:hypothetical protein
MSIQLDIDVQVHSAKGIIHGGRCSLDVTKNISRASIPLKKCSDKAATLTLSLVP